MKDSGTHVKIGDLCELYNGRAFKPEEWCEQGLPIVRIQNLNDESKPFNYYDGEYSEQHEVNSGDLLFSWSGTPGTSFGAFFWNRGKGVLNQHIFNVRFDAKRVHGSYFRYAINARLNQIIGHAHGGVGLKHITKGKFESVEIPLPPLSEQKRIAEILDRAEALRAKRRAALALLDELTQSIFLDMFGDPVSNPKGWETTSIGKHAKKIGSGATPRGGDESYKSEGISLIRSLNVRDGELTLRDLAFIDDEQARKLDNVIVENGDVLLNITGASVARVCRAPQHVLPARVNQHVCIIRTSELLNSRFLESQLLTPQSKRTLLGIAEAGATRQAITKSQVEGFQIILPPRKLQDEFENRMTQLSEVRESFARASEGLDQLFASLQHRAFRGEL